MTDKVFLDHYQTEQFGLYWRHYPEIGLDAGLLCNLLLYGAVGLDPDCFYPDEIHHGTWSDAFDRFLALGILDLARDADVLERATAAIFGSHALSGLNVPDFQDVFNYDFCVRHEVPFCISRRRAQDIDAVVAIAHKVFGSREPPQVDAPAPQRRSAVAEWLFDIEVPALAVRNDRMRRELFLNRPHMVASSSSGATDEAFTRLLLASKWSDLQAQWFISPEELVGLFSDIRGVQAVRAAMTRLAEHVSSKAETCDDVKSQYEALNQTVGRSDWVFTGVNLAFCWAPFSGAVTAPAQVGANYVIRRRYEWLLFMNSLNRRLREATVPGLGTVGPNPGMQRTRYARR